MIAEQIKKELAVELVLCQSSRDLDRVFKAAEDDFRERQVSAVRRNQVLQDVKGKLEMLIERKDDPKSQALVFEAKSIIDRMLFRIT